MWCIDFEKCTGRMRSKLRHTTSSKQPAAHTLLTATRQVPTISSAWPRSRFAAGNLLTKTTYQGSTTRYTYDGAGTLVAISNPDYLTVNYQYDAAGRLLSRVMSSGARSLYG